MLRVILRFQSSVTITLMEHIHPVGYIFWPGREWTLYPNGYLVKIGLMLWMRSQNPISPMDYFVSKFLFDG